MQKQLPVLDFAGKRDFIESMGITVWMDGMNPIEVTGFIPTEEVAIVHTQSLLDLPCG